ncbi:recombinase family protein [Desertivirga arenae]|uniref:recombinase family protein n=1 Tax=Desertivirga arenae TaxID=2810309 RepID=UPI001A9692AF|nr:recombinase family protein [Pedobacter sp. SYSU D00823]
MKIGYARVSTQDQNLELQIDALKKDGCEKIFKETGSGKNKERPGLRELMEHLRANDTVVVWKLDRLGRSLKDLIDLVGEFEAKGANFVSLNDRIDTSTPAGKFVFNVFASLAEFEREIIRERTVAGLAAARVRGRNGGRPEGLSPEALNKANSAFLLFQSGEKTVKEISKELGISRATCYRYIEAAKSMKKI